MPRWSRVASALDAAPAPARRRVPMTSLTQYLEHWTSAQPEATLFSFVGGDGRETEGYTYRAFLERTRHLAGQLRCRWPLERGDRVLLVYPPGLESIAAFFACSRLGAIPVPVAPPSGTGVQRPLAAIDRIAAECEARGLLTTTAMAEWIATRDREASSTGAAPWIATDATPPATTCEAAEDPHPTLFLQYTSGSTGAPRGVVVSHRNVIHNALATIGGTGVGVTWLPQYHDMGLIGFYLYAVVVGGTTFGMSPSDFLKRPALWLQTISRVRATHSSSPNFGFEYCLRPGKIRSEDTDGLDLRSLRLLMNGAEPARPETRDRFVERFAPFGLDPQACVVAYGLAEHTLAATRCGRRTLSLNRAALRRNRVTIDGSVAGGGDTVRVASCGTPLDEVDLRVVDSQTGQPLGDRQIGEIWLAGPSVASGYWRPDAARDAFGHRLAGETDDTSAVGRFLRTGDLGFVDEGELFVCGRRTDLIVVRGVNHYPHDVEAAIADGCPMVRAGGAVAFSTDDEPLVVAVEVRKQRPLPDPTAIVHAIAQRCAVTPDSVVFVPPGAIPQTTSGKIARRIASERFMDGTMPKLLVHRPRASAVDPAGGLRARFHAIFSRAEAASSDATIADLGLDSLVLTELWLALDAALRERGAGHLVQAIDMPLLQRLTVATFSELIDRLEDGGANAIEAIAADLRRIRDASDVDVGRRMRADAELHMPLSRIETADGTPISNLLMTGATGFFGPFLLRSLLEQTPYTYHVLVRAADGDAAMARVREALRRTVPAGRRCDSTWDGRIHVICGDIAQPDLGLPPLEWERLAGQIDAVVHNAAAVNYVANYEALRAVNVEGTRAMLRFAATARPKQLHYISSTFIFGWTARGQLLERDDNDEMADLDFGYAQTKWVAEQLVLRARERGLDARIYRPSLLSATTEAIGDASDVAIRVLAFMIKHGIAVDTKNQVSILPADVAADNIASIVARGDLQPSTFHVTVDGYYNVVDLTSVLARDHGFRFTYYDIPSFIEEMNRRCTSADPLYPLLDFFNRSATKIAAMQLKRYRNDSYYAARRGRRADPTLSETASYLVAYLAEQGLIPAVEKCEAR